MYRAVTRQIEVVVEPSFLPERSSIEKQQYFWAYTVAIVNKGPETVQLKTRHWIITDGSGRSQEVRGEGVHVSIDGKDVVLSGTAGKEVRLTPAASPDVVRINHMPSSPTKPAPAKMPDEPSCAPKARNSANGGHEWTPPSRP